MISGTVVQGIPTDHPANHQAQYSQPIYSHHSSLGFAGPVVFLVVGAGEDVEASSTRYSCLKRLLISGRLFGVFSSRFTGNYDCKSELSSLYENDAQVCSLPRSRLEWIRGLATVVGAPGRSIIRQCIRCIVLIL